MCTGTLDPSLLSEAEALIGETRAFELPPWLGEDCIHCEQVSVRLVSEGGLANAFSGISAPTLERYRAFAERVWAQTDFEACPPPPMSPGQTMFRVAVDATTPSVAARARYAGYGWLQIELRPETARFGIDGYAPFLSDAGEATPLCELEVADGERAQLFDAVRRAALQVGPGMCDTDEIRSPTDLRVFGVALTTRVPAFERTSLERRVGFPVCDDHHASHGEVEDAVRALLDRCG